MKVKQLRGFAEKIIREAALIAETFDGTIGDGSFRNRVATCYYATGLFAQLTGMRPAEYLKLIQEEEEEKNG